MNIAIHFVRVLVTGASGFIGSKLCIELLRRKFQVIGLVRDNDFPISIPDEYRDDMLIVKVDISDQEQLKRILARFGDSSCIFHTAGLTYKSTINEASPYFISNLTGTMNLLECCRLFNIKKFVYSSSTAVYGVDPHWSNQVNLVIDEQLAPSPYEFYGLSKHLAEIACNLYHNRFGIDVVILRYSKVYGPSGDRGLIFNTIRKAMKGDPIIIEGDVTLDFVLVDDVVEANIKALEINGFEVFNIGSGESISLTDMASKIVALTKSTSVVHTNNNGKRFQLSYDMSKAKKMLGINSSTLENGLQKYIQYVMDKHAF